MVYRDFITLLIFGVLSFTTTPIFTFKGAIVSEIQKCLPEAICCCITRFTLFTEILSQRSSLVCYILSSHQFPHFVKLWLVRYGNASLRLFFYKIYMVYRDFITTLIFGVLSSTITPISTFTGAFVSEIQ